ncbi:MAG: hypothetical protein OEW64_02705 [Gammaproteobacteria bacterium]|nr:hypothetical protein [Gammaproteobacteria bacterium]MDH5302989.1 hypothetical protein [Gammaproteobacteria bacterium]MDH5321264.1 hypothetical protein [Gammaproteobacteria bacterium]
MTRFFRWLVGRFSAKQVSPRTDLKKSGSYLRQTGHHAAAPGATRTPAVPERQPEVVRFDGLADARIEDLGPGKNVLIRKYIREDTGTHETLTILDENAIDTEEQVGIDPYNTGRFDRSKHWDKRSRKN